MEEKQGDVLWIYLESLNERVVYAFSLLFKWVFPLAYRLTIDLQERENYTGPRLSYSLADRKDGSYWLPAGSLLFEKGIRSPLIEVDYLKGAPFFFRTSEAVADLPFDLPAMAFYLASRYEEYCPYTPDVHGRFPASQSLAGRNGFLRMPVINLWVTRLVEALKTRYPDWPVSPPEFRVLPTFDIDLAWAFLHRSGWVQVGGTVRALLQGRWLDLQKRLQTLVGRRGDPFFTFPVLRQLHPPGDAQAPIFFFLLGNYGPFDKNISHADPTFRTLIAGLACDYQSGIHLSYRSNEEEACISLEINRLADITGAPVVRNRQHFLKLHLPDTYRRLLANHIQEDYTMGYADDIGFRAGLANPFPWYDLQAETATDLLIYPFQVMDVSLKNYLQWTPEEAWVEVRKMLEQTQRVGGQFCTLWHNSSFGDLEGWEPWTAFYQRLMNESKALL